MDKSLCRLTFVCPPRSVESIIELMLSLDPPLPGFTTWDAEGHGFGFAGTTVNERVRGRVKRNLITTVVARIDAERLLEAIAQKTPVPDIAFWIEPVERFGRLQKPTSPSAIVADGRALQ
ncbi:MAG: DUF3240 family protein [Proteobacteria bacterium]|nr:DUF3240 family protein [Pseudomonadota bacterium]